MEILQSTQLLEAKLKVIREIEFDGAILSLLIRKKKRVSIRKQPMSIKLFKLCHETCMCICLLV